MKIKLNKQEREVLEHLLEYGITAIRKDAPFYRPAINLHFRGFLSNDLSPINANYEFFGIPQPIIEDVNEVEQFLGDGLMKMRFCHNEDEVLADAILQDF